MYRLQHFDQKLGAAVGHSEIRVGIETARRPDRAQIDIDSDIAGLLYEFRQTEERVGLARPSSPIQHLVVDRPQDCEQRTDSDERLGQRAPIHTVCSPRNPHKRLVDQHTRALVIVPPRAASQAQNFLPTTNSIASARAVPRRERPNDSRRPFRPAHAPVPVVKDGRDGARLWYMPRPPDASHTEKPDCPEPKSQRRAGRSGLTYQLDPRRRNRCGSAETSSHHPVGRVVCPSSVRKL